MVRRLVLLLAGRSLAPVIAGMCHWVQTRAMQSHLYLIGRQ